MSEPTELTEEYLAELQAICDAATEGPWVVSNGSASWSPKRGGRCPVYFDGDNLQLAAASRTALPLLIAEVRRLRSAILSFGNGNDFDWNVLGKIDELETENSRLRGE